MTKFFRSLGYAWHGMKTAMQNEQNLKIHIFIALIVIACSYIFNISTIEWLIVLLCIGVVIFGELINTAIEKLCDRVTKENDNQIKAIKDISAAAVLIISIIAAIIGSIIFFPKFLFLIK